MEDFKIDIMIESGPEELCSLILIHSLIGATTRSGLLPYASSFCISSRLQYYTELLTTIVESASILKMPISMEAAIEMQVEVENTAYSECCVRDFCTNKGNGTIDIEIARYALKH
jgi:Holliday junction DNA helicase RuvB